MLIHFSILPIFDIKASYSLNCNSRLSLYFEKNSNFYFTFLNHKMNYKYWHILDHVLAYLELAELKSKSTSDS